MKGLSQQQLWRLRGGRLAQQPDWVAVEEPLEIRICSEPVAVTMRTPGDDARLALGFLFAEGILRSLEDVGTLTHCGKPGEPGYGNIIELVPASGARLPLERLESTRRGTLTTAACGVCGRRSVDDLLSLCGALREGPRLPIGLVAKSSGLLGDAQQNFARSGGVHAALALDAQGQRLASFEDIGRHNAVDKVVGELLLADKLSSAAVLVVSGRASFEIVQKAAMAAIPVVSCVSAASSLAIELAQRANITLASFVRDGDMNLHTHPERLCDLPSTG